MFLGTRKENEVSDNYLLRSALLVLLGLVLQTCAFVDCTQMLE